MYVSHAVPCLCRGGISKTGMDRAASLSTDASSRMNVRLGGPSTLDKASSPWPTVAKTPMVLALPPLSLALGSGADARHVTLSV